MSSEPERRVLAQDQAQRDQSTKRRLVAQQKEAEAQYQKDVAAIERENLSEQQRYERELAAFEKANQVQDQVKARQDIYDSQIQQLEEKRADELKNAYNSVWGAGGSRNRNELNAKQNKINNRYESKIKQLKEQRRVDVGTTRFFVETGRTADPSVLRAFKASSSLTSLGSLQARKDASREARLEYQKRADVTTARSEAGKIQDVMSGIGERQTGYGLSEGSERAAAIRPTPNIITGKQAEKTRRPLINVDTGQSIMGKQGSESVTVTTTENRYEVQTSQGVKTFKTRENAEKYSQREGIIAPTRPVVKTITRTIPGEPTSVGVSPKTNPIAKIAGMMRQDLEPSGLPPEPQTILSFQNISDVREESGRALLEFQSQLKTRTAPSASVYKGILEEKGLPLTPLSKRIIDTFSSKGIFNNYNEPIAAKGKKGIISKDGEILFNRETGEGSIRIGRLLGYEYSKPVITKEQQPQQLVIIPGSLDYILGKKNIEKSEFNPITEAKKSFTNYLEEINPQSKRNQLKYKDMSGGVEPINTLDIALIASPGGKILSGLRIIKNTKIIRKPFSYETPYKPTKRANEIDYKDSGEIIGKFSNLKSRPVAATQKDIVFGIKKPIKTIKIEPSYKPASRANEIEQRIGIIPKENIKGVIKFSRGFIPNKPIQRIKGRISEPVKLDPSYKPASRANEIGLPKEKQLIEFKTTKINLGKSITLPTKTFVKGKQTEVIKEDYFYKPARRANEIDYTDFAEKQKIPKIEMEKSEVQLDLKRELKRLKRKQPEFKMEKISFGGEGQYISGKSGRQNLLLIQKQETITKKKLLTKRKTPLSIDWSERIETVKTPKTGIAPITIPIPIKQKEKKKPYLTQRNTIEVYEVPLSDQRPKIKTISKTENKTQVRTTELQIEALKIKPNQINNVKEKPKSLTRQTYRPFEIYVPKERQKTKAKERTVYASPYKFPIRNPVRLVQPAKLRQPAKQIFKYNEPEQNRPQRALAALLPKENKIPKSVLKKQKEKADFLGASSELQISGVFKRADITYGQKKIAKLLKGDVRVVQGKKRNVKRGPVKWKEGKSGDMFGFKNEAKKKKTRFW